MTNRTSELFSSIEMFSESKIQEFLFSPSVCNGGCLVSNDSLYWAPLGHYRAMFYAATLGLKRASKWGRRFQIGTFSSQRILNLAAMKVRFSLQLESCFILLTTT